MRHLILLLALALACTTTAQPTWRFHLAFEDGTGARDTIWMVYDTTATTDTSPWPGPNVDSLLGEGKVHIDTSIFNVWMYNPAGDTTKTRAYPYSVYPSFDGTIIDAINWVPPMTITWDTSLFHAPYLPYEQGSIQWASMTGIAFSQFDQGLPGFGLFSMLLDDSVTIDQLWDYLFPFPVLFSGDNTIGINSQRRPEPRMQLWPNPAQRLVHVQVPGGEAMEVLVSDLIGRRVIGPTNLPANGQLDISALHTGIYHIVVRTLQNHIYHGTIEKVP